MSTEKNPIVTIEMENGDIIKAELYPKIAPKSVQNFIDLIEKGFYDGTIFHRVIQGFMIQGGDPDGTGMGGPGYSIVGEFDQNGFPNPLKHTRGVLSMARSSSPDSAGSQFFIMTAVSPHLDGSYAAFGKVLDEKSLEAVDRIVMSKTPRTEISAGTPMNAIVDAGGKPVRVHQGNSDMPLTPCRMRKVTVTVET